MTERTTFLAQALEIATVIPAIPDGPMNDQDLENLAECAATAASVSPERLVHVAAHDVPRLLREIVRLREVPVSPEPGAEG